MAGYEPYNRYDGRCVSWAGYVTSTDPAQYLRTSGWVLDDLDRDLSDEYRIAVCQSGTRDPICGRRTRFCQPVTRDARVVPTIVMRQAEWV